MQISSCISFSFHPPLPIFYPHHTPFSFPIHPPQNPDSNVICSRPAAVPKRAGFMSVIERAMEEDEYQRSRAEVQKKGVDVEGYFFEWISMGGHETCVVVPSLNAAFDIGRCPARAVSQDFLFITHAHLDHIAVNQLCSHFEAYRDVPKIAELREKFKNIKKILKSHVFSDFSRRLKSIDFYVQIIIVYLEYIQNPRHIEFQEGIALNQRTRKAADFPAAVHFYVKR